MGCVRDKKRLICLTALALLAALTIVVAVASKANAVMTVKDMLVRASYIYINNDLFNEAAAVYMYKPDGTWAAIRWNKDSTYMDLSEDSGSTWNRITTENIDTDTDTGEVNTASNIGGQLGVFAQKVAADLQFNTLQSTLASLGLYQVGNVLQIYVVPGAIVHDELQAVGTKTHAELDSEVGANTAHASSDGSGHSDVAANTAAAGLNTTHRTSDGKDHSDVVANTTAAGLNTTHRSSNGTDHAYVKKSTFDETAAPTVNDDSGDGFGVGSFWHDIAADKSYVCLDSTGGSAVWILYSDDETAIHTDEANEIGMLESKINLVNGDIFLIEDSANDYAKMKTTLAYIADAVIEMDIHNAWMITDRYFASGIHPTDNQVPTFDSATGKIVWEAPPGAGGGEANTYSNSGAGGVGVILTKAGIDLPFKSLNAGSANITVTNDAGNNEVDIDIAASVALATGDTHTGTHDFGGATLEIPNAEADATLGNAGEIATDGADDAIAGHFGAGGEIAGEAQISAIPTFTVSTDPGIWYDSVGYIPLGWIGDEAPNGIIIDEWKVSCNVDPDVEMDLDMYYADAMIGLANATLMDVLDTTNGASSEDTDASINGGAALANGKFWYLPFGADPEGTCTCLTVQIWYHAEED